MNSHTDSKFFVLLWWGVVPFLSALLINSIIVIIISFIYNYYGIVVKRDNNKVFYMSNVPLFISLDSMRRKSENKNLKSVQKWDDIELKACYMDENKRFVIIQDQAKTLFLYLNDTYKGAKLVEIGANYAIFIGNGKKIKLSLLKYKGKIYIKNKKLFQESSTVKIKRDSFLKYENNLFEVLKDIGFKIVSKNGAFDGIKMEFIKKGSFFDKIGLKKGDVIKYINGQMLSSPTDILAYYYKLNKIKYLTIGLSRNNRIKEISYEIH